MQRLLILALALGTGTRPALHAQAAHDVAGTSSLPNDPDGLAPAQTNSQNPSNPAAPRPSPTPTQSDNASTLAGHQTKRILGIIPNFRSVSVDQKLPPESVKEKFKESSLDAFDYSDVIYSGALAGIAQAENSVPEFRQGAAGYGRYFWHTFADQVDEDYQVEFFFPVVLHQDPRFYTLGHGGVIKRASYAFSRIFVTRTDSSHEAFNASEIVGAGAASGISDLYYPSEERTWTKTGQRWLINVSLDGFTYVFQEFWPDLNSRFFHQKD
ncbi:MAG: hypothetical protein WBW84_08760 [Acidobacteriaceae bacterium]